MHVDNKIVEGL